MQKVTRTLAEPGRKEALMTVFLFLGVGLLTFLMILNPTFASTDYTGTITEIVQQIVDIVGLIFQVVGVILLIYAIGQLVLAFKNEDANSKSSASTLLVVGVVLIALPAIIDALDLVSMIGA